MPKSIKEVKHYKAKEKKKHERIKRKVNKKKRVGKNMKI